MESLTRVAVFQFQQSTHCHLRKSTTETESVMKLGRRGSRRHVPSPSGGRSTACRYSSVFNSTILRMSVTEGPIDIAQLKAEAMKVTGEFTCSKDCWAGAVGSALLSRSGQIFTGICIDTACSLGFCAEHSAIAEMLKARQTAIRAIVAVKADGRVIPPCGRCREFIRQVDATNWDAQVILSDTQIVSLRELLPYRE